MALVTKIEINPNISQFIKQITAQSSPEYHKKITKIMNSSHPMDEKDSKGAKE